MIKIANSLINSGFSCYLASFSAIDYYFYKKIDTTYLYIITNASVIDIAKLFDNTLFLSIPFYNIAIRYNDKYILFACDKDIDSPPEYPFNIQYFFYNFKLDKFISRNNSFESIKRKELNLVNNNISYIGELAKIVAKYNFQNINFKEYKLDNSIFNSNYQREILLQILEGNFTDKGFKLLLESGFIEKYWEEIYHITKINHIKDFHPEGNVWEHTLETFQYVKRKNFITLLALLLHDIGKASAMKTKNKPFDKHAEIGARITEKFLKKLNFEDSVIEKVAFLVKYHMLPPAIEKIPFFKIEHIVKNENFPLLFDIYKADIASSYKPLTAYYKAKKFYKKLRLK